MRTNAEFLADYEAGLKDLEGEPSSGFWDCPECGSSEFHNCDGCADCGLSTEDASYAAQNEFSASTCDVCGTYLAGYRESVIGWLKGARDAGYTDEFRWEGEICADCLVFGANGDLPND